MSNDQFQVMSAFFQSARGFFQATCISFIVLFLYLILCFSIVSKEIDEIKKKLDPNDEDDDK